MRRKAAAGLDENSSDDAEGSVLLDRVLAGQLTSNLDEGVVGGREEDDPVDRDSGVIRSTPWSAANSTASIKIS